MQHDRGGWRCLVAGSFQVATEVAIGAFRREPGGANLAVICWTAPACLFTTRIFVPAVLHGSHDRPAGTAASANNSVLAITCAKLVTIDDDFARKYL